MARVRIKVLTWMMSVFVFIWLVITLFSERDACTYDLEDNYYYEEKAYTAEKVVNTPNKLPIDDQEMLNLQTEKRSSNTKAPSVYTYNHRMPIIFIGGIAGSGLELLRELLNQDQVPGRLRCGVETQLITQMIEKKVEWLNIRMEKERLKHAGMTDELIDSAVAQFILQVLLRQAGGDSTPLHICNKDIYAFKWAQYLKSLFPNAKFLLVVRDPRATVTSLIKRKFQYENINIGDYRSDLSDWNKVASDHYDQCVKMSPLSCHVVFYEQLVMKTNETLNEIYRFLDFEMSSHRFSFTEHRNGIDMLLNKVLVKRDNIFSWLNDFPQNLVYAADKLAPLMTKLGYDTSKIVPNKLVYYFNTTSQ